MGGILGAMHGMDNSLVFGNIDPMLCGSGPGVERLSEKIQDSCAAFAHTGDPSCESIGQWPVYGRERVTMILDLDTLGFGPGVLEQFKSLLKKTHGLILVCGPTGSGKTTTLYAAITLLNITERNIITMIIQ